MSNLYKAGTRNKGRAGRGEGVGEKRHTAGEEDTPRNVAMERMKNLTGKFSDHRETVVSMKKVPTLEITKEVMKQ